MLPVFSLCVVLALSFCSAAFAQLASADGSANNTVFIIPVDISLVRSLVPREYGLLPVDGLLPNFPVGKHPFVVYGGQDYNITTSAGLLLFAQGGLHIPYIDRLGDGKSNFALAQSVMMDNVVAVSATLATTGTKAFMSNINPSSGSGMAFAPQDEGLYTFDANAIGGGVQGIYAKFKIVPRRESPWPLASFGALFNLPQFPPDYPLCSSHVESNPTAVQIVRGNVTVNLPPLSSAMSFTNVYGLTAVKTFSEQLSESCSGLAS